MRLFSIVSLMLAILLIAPDSQARAMPEYSPSHGKMLWFMVISDTHIGAMGSRPVENLTWAVNDAFHIVQPQFILNCGDLVDANAALGIPWAQQEDEWRTYNSIISDSDRALSEYIDIPGNHDQYGDGSLSYYRQWSHWGSHYDRTQHSVRLETDFGIYHFLGVATPGNDGAKWPADNTGLDQGELAYIQQAFDENTDASLHVVFGHHPTSRLKYGKDEFLNALKHYEADMYIYGHTHKYEASFQDSVLHFNIDTLGKGDRDNVTIGVIDQDYLAMRAFSAGIWPYVVVTAPADAGFAGGNPRAYSVPPDWTEAPVRAVVFADRAPDKVEFQLNSGQWIEMTEVSPSVWQGYMDTTGLAAGRHNLTVRALPWDRSAHKISFRVGPTACSNGIDDDFDGLTDWPEDPGCESPGSNREDGVVIEEPDPDPDPEPDPEPEPEPVPDEASEEVLDDALAEELNPDEDVIEPEEIVEAEVEQDLGAETIDEEAVDNDGLEDDRLEDDVASQDTDESQDVSNGLGDVTNFDVNGSGGCSADGGRTSGWVIPLFLGLLLVVRRKVGKTC
jgi:predicted phosphodiesterase